MEDETRKRIIKRMESRFQCAIPYHQTTYIQELNDSIIIYDLEICAFYRAKERYIDNHYHNIADMKKIISKKHKIKDTQEESYFYMDTIHDIQLPYNIKIKTLKEHHLKHLHELKAQCDPQEVDAADIDLDDYIVFGLFCEGKLASASSAILMDGAYDIGILTLPQFRQKGFTTQLVQYCANWVISQGGLCQYRCENSNLASYKTAIAAGFTKCISVGIINI